MLTYFQVLMMVPFRCYYDGGSINLHHYHANTSQHIFNTHFRILKCCCKARKYLNSESWNPFLISIFKCKGPLSCSPSHSFMITTVIISWCSFCSLQVPNVIISTVLSFTGNAEHEHVKSKARFTRPIRNGCQLLWWRRWK